MTRPNVPRPPAVATPPLPIPEAARQLLFALLHEHITECGGWQAEQEYAIWEEAQEAEPWPYGIGRMNCDTLRDLSGLAEGWYAWDRDFGAPVFVSMDRWERMFRLWLKGCAPERERERRAMKDEIDSWLLPDETNEHYVMRQHAAGRKVDGA
jgi:hypothetical protein